MRLRTLLAVGCLLGLAGCASWGARLHTKPGLYVATVRAVHAADANVHATYIRPERNLHPGYFIIFVTGDEGWFATSRAVFSHLADEGYMAAGFSAPEIIDEIVNSEHISTTRAARAWKEIFKLTKQHLHLPASTPIVMVGFSRGASTVAFTAMHPELRHSIKGSVAIALTRETDYVLASEAALKRGVQVDTEGRIQLYPSLKSLCSTPLAVIQSTNDSYVRAAESRRLLGPNTSTLRLYTVEARDHGFSDARDKLLRDLDDALQWIEG